jgi:hypothetical protein
MVEQNNCCGCCCGFGLLTTSEHQQRFVLGSFLMRNPKDNTREQKLQKEMQEHSSATKVKSKDDQVKEN